MTKATAKATPKKRRDRHKEFLAGLCLYGNVTRAAEEAGLDRVTLYRKRRENEDFAAEWDKALEIGVAALEDEAKRRAYEGWLEPVFYQGSNCGTVRKFSDTLLIVLLKAHMPDKYAERSKAEHSGKDGGPLSINIIRFGEEAG